MTNTALDRARGMWTELVADLTSDPEATIEDFRRKYEEFAAVFPILEGTQIESVDLGGVAGLDVRAPGADPERTIVHLHGGGYVIGSANAYRAWAADLSAASGARVVLPDYRMAPEHRHPASVDDAVAVVEAVLAAGADPGSVVVSGDSAGGGLALATLVALRDRGVTGFAGGLAFSPWTDSTLTSASMQENAHLDPIVGKELIGGMALMRLGEDGDPRDPLASPLFADLAGLPPLRIFVGTAETLLDDSRSFAAAASEAGTPVELTIEPDMVHVWPIFASFLPEGQRTFDQAGAFVRDAAAVAG